MRKNITITWANEKGGVGKTTLCTLFANYLSEKHQGEVCVLDCDRQHSIVDKRKYDSQSLQTEKVPYDVRQIEIDRLQQSAQLLKSVKSTNGIYLFDSPGNIYLEGMVPLLGFSDVIICPYQYEFNCLSATQKFLNLVGRIWITYLKGRQKPRQRSFRLGRRRTRHWRRLVASSLRWCQTVQTLPVTTPSGTRRFRLSV